MYNNINKSENIAGDGILSKVFDKTFIKFIAVGIVNTLFGTVIMFLFYNCLHLDYWISTAANYFFGSILSYILNKYVTFKYKEKSIKVIVKFVVNIVVCYIVAYGAARPLVHSALAGFNEIVQDNISMVVGMCIFVILNYFGQRFFAFKK